MTQPSKPRATVDTAITAQASRSDQLTINGQSVSVEHGLVSHMTDLDYKACLKLTLVTGSMRSSLARVRHVCQEYDGQRIPAHLRGSKRATVTALRLNGVIIAWALTRYYGVAQEPCTDLFVKTAYRRSGLGTLLVKEVLHHHRQTNFCPWDGRSCGFFTNYQRPLNYLLGYQLTMDRYLLRQAEQAAKAVATPV